MTKIIVAAAPATGHFTPVRAVAQDLVNRGHDVTLTSGSQFGAAAEATGARFVPLHGIADFAADDEEKNFPEMADIPPGPERLGFGVRNTFVRPMPDQHRTLQALLAEAGDEPVALVHELAFMGAWPVRLGAPGLSPAAVIGLGVVPLSLSSEDLAPFGLGQPPDDSPEGKVRNRAANRFFREEVFATTQQYLVDVLASVGATREPPFVIDGLVTLPDRFLQLSVQGVDYPRGDLPPSVRYVGAPPPVTTRKGPLPEWWQDVLDARTVVVVSQGTAANKDFDDLVQPTLDALADLDALVVATLGRPARLDRVPANARVAEFIPFGELLPHADVLVSNGGFGGVQQALSSGVPLVLAGLTEDKMEVNARAAWTGAAIDLAVQRPARADIARAVRTVLTDPSYRYRAARLAEEYARHDPFDAIEESVLELVAASASTPGR
ncbi:UDP:flavonoid glycosyltransferase YjiC (YdhE family) [Saccharothrix coeruleofusca]|uniref:nucleotide disphospho-sugar-binding domain-containing protein n=1 Tax=Saccharothrix coeruleofusca TaxID=33919 RepID=UPI001AE9B302|nr:glycosyltransferase [Saccharothrix coeruleofusca]MBP2335877.1 UDP:flavonoid glycosyltransferase YjiC (YdhE family) [Saccharothrix coeruleofusca]